MMINDVPDLAPFREAVQKVYVPGPAASGAQDKVDEVLKRVEEIRAKYPKDGSYIGLEAK